jgi:predicted transcriptional regulator
MVAEPQSTLSPTEWQIMSAVWELGKADASEVSALLQRRYGRACPPKTAGIFLARLVQRGFLRHTTIKPVRPGRPAHIYSPSIARQDALRRQIQKFLEDYGFEAADFETLQEILIGPPRHALVEER